MCLELAQKCVLQNLNAVSGKKSRKQTGHEDDAIVYDNGVPGTYKVKGVLM